MTKDHSGSEKEQAWVFDRGTWSKIEEIVFYNFNSEVDDFSVALQNSGYIPDFCLHYGNAERGIDVKVYEADLAKPAPYPYYLYLMMGSGNIEFIYVVDFPSLLMILSQLNAITGNLNKLPYYP